MKVRCKYSTGGALPSLYLDEKGGFSPATIFPLSVDGVYLVYAVTLRRGGVWYYLFDDRALSYPIWYPAPLFNLEDPRLSRFWIFGYAENALRDGDCVFAIPEWSRDPYKFYDLLSDGDEQTLARFQKYASLMEAEFADGTIALQAESLGDGWMQCPNCLEAWKTTVLGELLTCPNCNVRLRNPNTLCQ